jgi:NitT/TauT family transport system substrate-binding protein
MYRAFALMLMVSILLTGMAGCSRTEEQGASKQNEKITLAVSSWPASASIYVAHEKGFFEDEGLNATIQPNLSGHLGIDAVLSGKADLATAGETPITRAAVEDKPLTVIATVCEIDRAILVIGRKDKGISAPQDLKSKRIGVVSGTTADFFLHIYLTTSYIDPKDVRVVNLSTDKVVDALLNGEVDAVSTWAPHTLVLREKLGSNGIVLHDPNIYTMTWDIVASQDFVKKNPQGIKRFLRAILKATQFITDQPDETRAICSRHIGADSPLFEREWTDYRFTVKLDQSLLLNMEDQARWMSKKEGAGDRRPPNFMDFIDAEGLKAIKPLAVRITGK